MTTNRLAKAALPKKSPFEICQEGNAGIAALGRKDVEWFVVDDLATIGWVKSSLVMLRDTAANRVDVMDRRGQPMSESDTFKLNTELEKQGATARYRRDGSRYLLNHTQAA